MVLKMTLMASGLGGFGLYNEIKGTSACKFYFETTYLPNMFDVY